MVFDHDETHGREPFEDSFYPSDTFVSFSETQIQDYLFLPRRFFVHPHYRGDPDPVAAVDNDRSSSRLSFSSPHALLPPSLMDTRNVS
jgi:hypothetical protein